MEKKCIKVNHLSKQFILNEEHGSLLKRIRNQNKRTVTAVDDFCADIYPGEMVALLGENGAGKSTLIKMLTGILTPTCGSIEALGFNPVKDRYRYAYKIGVVMGQKSLLWSHIPVIESFKLYQAMYEIDDAFFEDRLSLFDDMLGIKAYLKTPVRKLSLGQRMRCEFAAALLHSPELLFLDEPTIGLDVVSKNNIYDFLKELNRNSQTTTILTSHDVQDAAELSDRVILIDGGKKIFDDTMEKLLAKNASKRIRVTGDISVPEELVDFVSSKGEGFYEFEVPSGDMQTTGMILSGLMGKLIGAANIEVRDVGLDTILSQVYRGELRL